MKSRSAERLQSGCTSPSVRPTTVGFGCFLSVDSNSTVLGAACPVGMCVHDHAVSTPLHKPVMSVLDVMGRMHAGLWLEGHRGLPWVALRWSGLLLWAGMIGSAGQRGNARRISTAMPISAPTISTSGVVPLRSFRSSGCMGSRVEGSKHRRARRQQVRNANVQRLSRSVTMSYPMPGL